MPEGPGIEVLGPWAASFRALEVLTMPMLNQLAYSQMANDKRARDADRGVSAELVCGAEPPLYAAAAGQGGCAERTRPVAVCDLTIRD